MVLLHVRSLYILVFNSALLRLHTSQIIFDSLIIWVLLKSISGISDDLCSLWQPSNETLNSSTLITQSSRQIGQIISFDGFKLGFSLKVELSPESVLVVTSLMSLTTIWIGFSLVFKSSTLKFTDYRLLFNYIKLFL